MLHYPCLSKFLNSHLQHMQYFIISKLLYDSDINTDLRNYWIFGINSLNIKFQLLRQIISECSIGKTFIVLWYSLSIFKSHNRPILTGKISDKDTVGLFNASASTIIFQFYWFVMHRLTVSCQICLHFGGLIHFRERQELSSYIWYRFKVL